MDSACLLYVYDFPKMMRVFMNCMGRGALYRGLVPCSFLAVTGDHLSFFTLFFPPQHNFLLDTSSLCAECWFTCVLNMHKHNCLHSFSWTVRMLLVHIYILWSLVCLRSCCHLSILNLILVCDWRPVSLARAMVVSVILVGLYLYLPLCLWALLSDFFWLCACVWQEQELLSSSSFFIPKEAAWLRGLQTHWSG